jgi:hypothetical protein
MANNAINTGMQNEAGYQPRIPNTHLDLSAQTPTADRRLSAARPPMR